MLTLERPPVMKSRHSSELVRLPGDHDHNGNIRQSKADLEDTRMEPMTQGGGDNVWAVCAPDIDNFAGGIAEAKGRNLGELREAAKKEGQEGSGDRKKQRRRSSSYVALRNAFSALYSGDDFWRERIASGFFSVVYKVTHRTTGEVLVMKMSQQTNTRANNLHEIELLNRLHHPNILRLKGVCIEGGQLHALTEYVNGGNLQKLICDDREYLSWPDRLKLSSDIADGMKYLHSKGFMHRDLSSQNILVRRKHLDVECVIADLGLAIRKPKSENDVLPVVGTPFWISPECLHGKFYGPESDVFSFGIVMCEVIARVSADPEELPRTMDFGLNEAAFESLAGNCPKEILKIAIHCCKICPKERPTFHNIVSRLSELRHSHVTNVSKSLSQTDAGTEMPPRSRSRTISKELPCLPAKCKKRGELVRSNSDCGMTELNFRKVSQRMNPFSESRPQANPEVLDAPGGKNDLRSPVTRLCDDLASVWPGRKPGLLVAEDTGEKNRFTSLPCINNVIGLLPRRASEVSSRGDSGCTIFDLNLKIFKDIASSVEQRFMLQEA